MGLGKLIGKRTWGGVVGIRNPLPLTDGGQLFRPEFAPYSKDGKEWIIEGNGVDPDIVVDNDPAKEFKGEDQQLDRAIEEIQTELKTKRFDLPPVRPIRTAIRRLAVARLAIRYNVEALHRREVHHDCPIASL